ncbi:MAG: low molecular weight phosphotyrosine protein phosphatase [Clostridia bacterium]|nr:low molecular weight phosphotyrosine protein phosphatase [Clostridia bacterium]
MMKVLMVCHGNICRSAAAEVVFNQLAREMGLERKMHADSAAATREEIGNDIYPPMKRALTARGYICPRHAARQTVREDYKKYDLIIGMDDENMSDMRYIYGGDQEKKLSRLLDWAGRKGEAISDPWYTRDFEGALTEIEQGCLGLLTYLQKE